LLRSLLGLRVLQNFNLRLMFSPSRLKPVLWPLLTSADSTAPSSAAYRKAMYQQTSPDKSGDFPLMSLPHLRLHLLAVLGFILFSRLAQMQTPHAVRVPQREDLPPASFRSHLAMGTLAFG
jgi:hypothetical protein